MRNLFLCIVLFMVLDAPVMAAKEIFAVVAHPKVVLKQVDRSTLLQVFLQRRLEDDAGNSLQLYSLETEHPVFYRFISECLLWNPSVLERVWRRNLFTGEGPVPMFVDDWQAMRQAITDTPGAIGYLPEAEVTPQMQVLWRCN